MLTTMETTMAEPVARSRQLASAQAQSSANGVSQANAGDRQFESPEARFYVEQLSVQERAILDDLLRTHGDAEVLKLDLPEAWRAYVRWTAGARGKEFWQGRDTYDRRASIDHLTERWLSAIRHLFLHQILSGKQKQKPRRLTDIPPARSPRIAEEVPATDLADVPDELLELAERLSEEASALAREFSAREGSQPLPPRDVLAAAGYLRSEAMAGRGDGWLASLWRYVRTGSLEPEAASVPAGAKIRIRLVGPDESKIDDLLMLEEAADYLGVSRGRVSQLLQEGTLTRYPLNERCNLVAKRDLDRYADSARRHMKRGL